MEQQNDRLRQRENKYQKGFEPLLEGFKYAELNNIDELKKSVDEKTSAIIIEPIQGEGGINVADQEYLEAIRELCDKNNAVMILDEVQTGQ